MKALVVLALAAGCTSDADVSGDYTMQVTNRDNGCMFGSWTPGETSTAEVVVTQNSTDVLANVTGLGAFALELAIGGHAFSGHVAGGDIDLHLLGTRSNMTGNCTYTFNAEIRASIDGDTLAGQINYVAATNGNPDCSAIAACTSFQEFTGTRPHTIYNSVTPGPGVSAQSAPPTAR